MRKLKRYKDGSIYETGGVASIEPNVEPVEEYEIDGLTDKQILKAKSSLKELRKLKRVK